MPHSYSTGTTPTDNDCIVYHYYIFVQHCGVKGGCILLLIIPSIFPQPITPFISFLVRYPYQDPQICRNNMLLLWAEKVVHCKCRNNYKSSLDLLVLGTAGSGLKAQYRKWRRGPVAAPATAAAETRTPSGAVSVPLPRTPNENILSKTCVKQVNTWNKRVNNIRTYELP
jgi:hypothetical protein